MPLGISFPKPVPVTSMTELGGTINDPLTVGHSAALIHATLEIVGTSTHAMFATPCETYAEATRAITVASPRNGIAALNTTDAPSPPGQSTAAGVLQVALTTTGRSAAPHLLKHGVLHVANS